MTTSTNCDVKHEAEIRIVRREAKGKAQLLAALDKMEDYFALGDSRFPSMVESAWQLYNDDRVDEKGRLLVSAKERIVIFATFARLMGVKEEALAAKGLKATPKKIVNNNLHVHVPFTLDEIKALPDWAKERLVRERLDGPKRVEAEVVATAPAGEKEPAA